MAIENAPAIPPEADAPKAEVHDTVDHNPSREVSKKRQSLSDLFTIVSDRWLLYRRLALKTPSVNLEPDEDMYSSPVASLLSVMDTKTTSCQCGPLVFSKTPLFMCWSL